MHLAALGAVQVSEIRNAMPRSHRAIGAFFLIDGACDMIGPLVNNMI